MPRFHVGSNRYVGPPFFGLHSINLLLANRPQDISIEDSADFLFDCLECSGVRIFDTELRKGYPYSRHNEVIASAGLHDVEHDKVNTAVQVLSSLRVIDEFDVDDLIFEKDHLLSVHCVKLTQLGSSFLDACSVSFDPPDFEREIKLY